MSSTAGGSSNSTQLPPQTYPLIVFGTVNVCINLLIIGVVLLDRRLRRTGAFICGLAGGNLFYGWYLLGFGVDQLLKFQRSEFARQTRWSCASEMVNSCALMAHQVTAFILTLIGVERLTAVTRPSFYRRHFRPKCCWLYNLGVYVMVAGGPVVAYFVENWIFRQSSVSWMCNFNDLIHPIFSSYLVVMSAVGGLICVLCTLVALAAALYRMRGVLMLQEQRRLKRQIQLTKAMLTVAILDCFCSILPNVVMICLPYITNPQYVIPLLYASLYVNASNSWPHALVYGMYNKDFRHAANCLLCWKRCKSGNSSVEDAFNRTPPANPMAIKAFAFGSQIAQSTVM